ncbi:MAG: hypothetical protein ABSA39_00005, partial [Edaphobacter sp.]
MLAVDEMPGGSGVVGEIDAAGGFRCVGSGSVTTNGTGDGGAEVIDDGVEAVGVAGRDGDADFANEFVDGKAVGEWLPGVAAVGGFKESAGSAAARTWSAVAPVQRSATGAAGPRGSGADGG